jgi:hypothetical protein
LKPLNLQISDSNCLVVQFSLINQFGLLFGISGRRIGGDEKKVETMAKSTVAE